VYNCSKADLNKDIVWGTTSVKSVFNQVYRCWSYLSLSSSRGVKVKLGRVVKLSSVYVYKMMNKEEVE
jgi:hypothetical protein